MAKPDFEYLDDERRKLWHKVNTVESELHKKIDEELVKKASDYSDEAKQSSKKASEFRNKSEEAKNTISQILDDINIKSLEINKILQTSTNLNSDIENNALESTQNSNLIKESIDAVLKSKEILEGQIAQVELIFDDEESITEKVQKINDFLTESGDTSSKIEILHKSLLDRKKEIDQVHLNIFGYKEKDTTSGEEIVVEGLKAKLDKSYTELSVRLKNSEEFLSRLKNESIDDYEIFSKNNASVFKETLDTWIKNYTELSLKIQELLPNALTAGLSSAYSEKKDTEIKEYSKLNKTFNVAIIGLVAVSLIPFGVSLFSINQNKPFENVLLDMPRLVLSILPLYIPVLWIAYSANRKMNLSKRLSEEYSHKEVLSKTFEGLSTQINSITDEKVSYDLRNKLLYNILEVSSENPGKLISDYNKSDHPLMDALDKSVKLATAFERLERIPGFSKLAKVMDKKSKILLEDENDKANKGLTAIDTED